MSTSNLYVSIDMEVSQVIGGTPNHCSIETQPYELPRNLSIFLGVTSRSQLSSTKTAEESQKNHWTVFQLVKGEKWPPCPEWKPRSSSDVSWVKLGWKKTSESRCLFLWWNSSSIRCLQAVKKMSNTHAHKEHQNGTLISRSIKKIRTIWSVGKFRPLSSYRPLVAPRPSRASPKNSPGPHSAMSTPCDSTSAVPWWIITSFFGHADTAQGATFWVTHIDIQGTYRLSWWSIYI